MRMRSSAFQSKISRSKLWLIKESNKLAPDVKLNETHLTIHPFSRQLKWVDLAFIGYTDAAEGGSIDGSSTRGYVLRMAPHRQSIH